jgi:uncharacterized protein YecE (DUF72 family)
MQILIGTDNPKFNLKRYTEDFNLLEYTDTYKAFVKRKTLLGLRKKAGEDFSFSLKAPLFIAEDQDSIKKFSTNIPILNQEKIENYGSFKNTEENQKITNILIQEIENLDADATIFYTSNKFQPTQKNIENINRYFIDLGNHLKENDRDLFWSPLGFWSEETILEAVKGSSVIPAYDPLMDEEIQVNPVVNYFLMRGLGRYSTGYSDSALEQVAEIIFDKGIDTYVVFQGSLQISNAKRFNEIIKYW